MELRNYQNEAVKKILSEWNRGVQKTLLVIPTGTGKTIIFCKVGEAVVRNGGRVLIIAHREELLNQAADKMRDVTGLLCAVEKAEQTAENTWFNITVGSIQSFNPKRLERIPTDTYSHIIIDEAHHTLASTYMRLLKHFPDAKVLGVTATADRGDKRNLGSVYETVAYEMTLPGAIRGGWLAPITAATLPLELSVSHSGDGDFSAAECASAIDPYLESIAKHFLQYCHDRKTVVFLPLIATSQHFRDILQDNGIQAKEINGESEDRADVLAWFHNAAPGSVLCNSMLLTEGWDEPSTDCICVLRPTKIRALYTQMVGRGTRLFPGKKNLLLLDFLWMTEKHDLCRPVHLVCDNPELQGRIAELLAEETQGQPQDLIEAAEAAESTAREEREKALRDALEAQRHKRAKLVDPLQYEMSISTDGKALSGEPDMNDLQSLQPPTDHQIQHLEMMGINPTDIQTRQQATRLLDTLATRRNSGLTTPKQIRLLERFGFQQVGTWPFDQARRMVDRIAASGWRLPRGVRPSEVMPEQAPQAWEAVK